MAQLKYRDAVFISNAARLKGTDFDSRRMDDLEDLFFLIWAHPQSGNDMDLQNLAYTSDVCCISNDYRAREIKNQLEYY